MEHLHNLPRSLAPAVLRALRTFSIVVVAGPRQVGKSTLVQQSEIGDGRLYLTLDDLALLEEARSAPDRLLGRAPRVTIDEVQRAPELLLAMKREVDRQRSPGRFLVTGSADVRGLRAVADRLPGRAVYLDLEPLSVAERRGAPDAAGLSTALLSRDAGAARDGLVARRPWAEPPVETVARGGFPEPALLPDAESRDLWFQAYVRSWLERGSQEIVRIDDVPDLRRVLLALAARTGGLLNQAEVARDAGLPRTTAHRYIALLSLGRLLDLLPAWSRSRSTRLVRAPHVFWRDAGLAAHLVGARPGVDARGLRSWGALLENLVLSNVRAWASGRVRPAEIHGWRTVSGREVDLVVEVEDRLVPVEVKSATRPSRSDLGGLLAFLEEHRTSAPYGLLLHTGSTVETPASNVVAAPIQAVL